MTLRQTYLKPPERKQKAMKNNYIYNTHCTATLASLTYAMKAQKALTVAGLYSEVIKLDSEQAKKGCAYGIKYPCEYESRVKETLESQNIGVRRYLKGGDSL